ncbi:MAG: SDR family NAD(P)-dependent oxidoreductase [Anaerolineae bacterium]
MVESTSRLLHGRVALVTGASRGIGRAVAIEMARQGAKVAVNAHRFSDAAASVAQQIVQEGGQAVVALADVAETDAVYRMVADVRRQLGPIDILVNNAGVGTVTTLEEMPPDEWDRVLNVNLKGVYNCCKAVVDEMKARRYGKIICVSSLAGLRGTLMGHVHYGASKAGVHGFAWTLARHLGPYGINVNVIAPGPVETEMLQESASEEYLRRVGSEIPLGRLGRPEDIAHVAVFLASDWAAYVTGVVVNVSGGLYMG